MLYKLSQNNPIQIISLMLQTKMSDPKSSPDLFSDTEVAEPALYRVLILNDDYSPMDFVVYVLKTFFGHDEKSAQKIMLDVHHQGAGTAGVYSFEIAETKAAQVNAFSKQNKYPLKCTIEEEIA